MGVSLADKTPREVAHSKEGEIRDYAWSPGGSYLSFSINDAAGFSAIYIWGIKDGQLRKITSGLTNENSAVWDPAGDYLYYLANHEFHPQISNVEFDFAGNRSGGIYALALRKDVKNPFPPESDEVTVAKPKDKDTDKEKEKDKDKKDADAVKTDKDIDFDGLAQRVTPVPVEANNYNGLDAKTGALLYSIGPAGYYGRPSDSKASLRIYTFKERKETTLADDIGGGFDLSRDGSKVLVRQGAQWNVYDATASGASSKKTVSTANLMLERVPTAEWKQIFDEVWRRYRDFFYDPNMHGHDWEAIGKRYRALLPYVAHRSDLNYVMGEMIAELTVQHTYIEGGDYQIPPRPHVGLPGARFNVDAASGRYRIERIFNGQNEETTFRAPLTEVGVDARVGDYVLAINGEEVTTKEDIYKWLRNAGDAPVELTLNTTPSLTGARKVSYRPLGSEADLIYHDWVERKRKRVDELSGGRIAYMHLPDMGANGIREFIKWYYPQLMKDAFLIDDRANGGGNISRMVIARLIRPLLSVSYSRTTETANAYPSSVFIGPKLVLIDGNSASDGDIFPWMFRTAGLGLLVGQRTWGGVVGISGHGPLMDGGGVSVPEFGYATAKGEWTVEGHGVDPDIVVENDAKSLMEGHDPQLERGVAELLKKLKESSPKLPAHAPYPVKVK